MKSMKQMQKEMLEKARFDGGYPKPIVLPMGILALAYNEKEEKEYMNFISNVMKFFLFLGIVALIAIPIFIYLISVRII